MKNLSKYISVLVAIFALVISCQKENAGTKNRIDNGTGGSTAQFTIVGDYLYTVDYKTLNVFHITDPNQPVLLEKVDLGIGIETIYPQNGRLYIGTTTGVRIFDVSSPRNPKQISEYRHVTACDPVIANDSYAFCTLRGGTACGTNTNQFTVIDLKDESSPRPVSNVMLSGPYGLGFAGSSETLVYVCDGGEGLKLFDVSTPEMPDLRMTLSGLETIDLIPGANSLIVLARDGIHQYDASNPIELKEISVIPAM